MGAAGSRIWSDICEMDSDEMRVIMLERVLATPGYAAAAMASVGDVYDDTVRWMQMWRRGIREPFPYRRAAAPMTPVATSVRSNAMAGMAPMSDRIEHVGERSGYPSGGHGSGGWSPAPRAQHLYAPPPAARAPAPSVPRYTETAMVVSPAAKAMDYFQESLAMLGIPEDEDDLTHEKIRAAFLRISRRAHPDKGGSKEKFDELQRAYKYVGKILDRIKPRTSEADREKLTAPVTMDHARASRAAAEPAAPVQLSAKKLDMSAFNRLFEENRLPDPQRDNGYGDWMSSQGGDDSVAADPRLKGKFNQTNFEAVFRERALKQTAGTEIIKRLEPDALFSPSGTEIGADTKNFTAAFGADTQFTDLKEAYTTGSTVFQEVADVRVTERSARSVAEAKRVRETEMSRVDPDESSRIAAAAAALERREAERRRRAAAADVASEAWSDQMRRRLFVTNS
jgi:curved DNA-binding protein CbpA